MEENELIKSRFIPLSKYWSMRLGFLDIINGTRYFIPLIEGREDVGDDLKAMIRISYEWKDKEEINVGEGGALFRYLQFASWKFNLEKVFIKEKTLKQRKICDNPEIVNWSISKLLELDNNTPQWASASILLGSKEEIPDDYFLNMSKEALKHYNKIRSEEGFCELRYDDTILREAITFMGLLKNGEINFEPIQQDEYCFARAFNLIDRIEGEKRWPELKGHESNRLEEMEIMLKKLENGEIIDSKDHRVVQAIAMLAFSRKKKVEFTFLDCVNKSWPQFWKFMDWVKLKSGNIIIIGFRGAGKTTISKRLSDILHMKRYSSDEEISNKFRMDKMEIVKRYGWEKFREYEKEIIAELSDKKGCIIDLGGGVVEDDENLILLKNKKENKIVFIDVSKDNIIKNLKKTTRISLTGRGIIDDVELFFDKRTSLYKKYADFIIDGNAEPESVVGRIKATLGC